MREILFRGKRLDNGDFIIGDLRRGKTGKAAVYWDVLKMYMDVDPETVGQYTGLRDKYEQCIFEGDIVLGRFEFGMKVPSVVVFRDGAFGLEWQRGDARQFSAFTSICNVTYEIVGNIHDNPELLEGGTTDGD